MFRGYLSVFSESMAIDEITAFIGLEPTRSIAQSTRRSEWAPLATENRWYLDLAIENGSTTGRADEVAEAVTRISISAISAFEELARDGLVDIRLVLVREVEDIEDPRERGIGLSATVIELLGRLRASVDIDEYFYLNYSAIG